MAKVFGFLVAEIRKFGAVIVSADSGRLVLATNKQSLDEATVRVPARCRFSERIRISLANTLLASIRA